MTYVTPVETDGSDLDKHLALLQGRQWVLL
jgi:hypothetical protein